MTTHDHISVVSGGKEHMNTWMELGKRSLQKFKYRFSEVSEVARNEIPLMRWKRDGIWVALQTQPVKNYAKIYMEEGSDLCMLG